LSLPQYKSGREELTLFSRQTKVIAICDNRKKSTLVFGVKGVVNKAVGLGG
jgi:hypothetical protein